MLPSKPFVAVSLFLKLHKVVFMAGNNKANILDDLSVWIRCFHKDDRYFSESPVLTVLTLIFLSAVHDSSLDTVPLQMSHAKPC